MEQPQDMLTVWIPLTPVKQPGHGQQSVVIEEGAIRLSLIREAIQLHSLVREVNRSVPEHTSFQMTHEEYHYSKRTKVTPLLEAGDALLLQRLFP